MSYTLNFSLSLGASKTGLADLRAQLVDSAGSNSGSAISTGFTEIGSGNYLWNYASFPDSFRGGVKFYSAATPATILVFAAINPEEAENTNAKISTRAVAGDAMTLASGAITAAVIATDAIDSDAIAASAVTEMQSGLATSAQSTSILAAIAAIPAAVWAVSVRTLSSFGTLVADIVAAIRNTGNLSIVSIVDGGTVTLYQSDTWRFTMTNAALNLSAYENVALVVKRNEAQTDDEAMLYLRSGSNGLQRIGGVAPVAAGNGTLTYDATSITVLVSIDETPVVEPGDYYWWLKVFDTTPADDEGFTVATGRFEVKMHGLEPWREKEIYEYSRIESSGVLGGAGTDA